MLIIHGTGHDDVFIEHPLIKKDAIELREYQVDIAKECMEQSTLVVLPTGLGKTAVALIVIANVLGKTDGKILFMAPTKPLVDQHAAYIRKNLVAEPIESFTGEVPAEKRKHLWESSKVIISTPQVVENDMDAGRCDISKFSLIIFDEAHRAVGDYAYVRIGERYSAQEGNLVMGTTASPGYDLDKISEVCRNLGIINIAVRSETDADVAPYVFGTQVEWVRVDVPEGVDEITDLLQKVMDERVEALRKYHVIDEKRKPGVRDLLAAGDILRAKISATPRNLHLFRALTIQASAIKINHAIDLGRTQGRESLRNYMQKIVNDAETKGGSRAAKELVKDDRFEKVRRLLDKGGEDHPKLDRMKQIINKQLFTDPDSKIIVFTHYRDMCDNATSVISQIQNAKPVRFVGQATKGADTGMKQKEQKDIIEKFKSGEYNVLVATSVAEEGLDIPSTDLVVFYEPVPSEIRTIQRRGRTGRQSPGKVIVLIAKSSKDEAYSSSSKNKERKMRLELDQLSRRLRTARKGGGSLQDAFEKPAEPEEKKVPESQALLEDFAALPSSRLRLIASGKRNEEVLAELKKVGITFDESKTQLEDFVIGDEVGVIRETIENFLHDIERPELKKRVSMLSQRHARPMMIVEGGAAKQKDIASKLPIYDIMNSLIRELQVPVMPTSSASDTAAFIAAIVKGEMQKRGSQTSTRATEDETAEFQKRMIQGLPNVTSVLAERLLERFGSVQDVLCASQEELMMVDGVGKVIAIGIRKIATDKYGPDA
jgi:Fanconi anemia group M protein